jgi:hypothetical protein
MKLSEYLRANTIRRIMLKDRNPLKCGGVLDCNKATYPDCAISTYWCVVAYENAVQLLIPEAIFWQEEWSSEEPIVSAIKSRYAVDLSDDSDSFDALINLVEHRKEARHCSYALYGMQQFTNELAIGIWGEQADSMMQKCFLDIYRRYKIGRRNRKRSKYSSKVLTDSWLYKWIDQKRLSDSLDPKLKDKVKTALFSIALDI